MPPLVVPGAVRYSVIQSLGGQQVVNIVDMRVDTTGQVDPREQIILAIARDLLNNWNDHILQFQVNDLTAEEVRWLDLDSLSGSTGTVSSSDDTTWPATGGEDLQSVMPAVVALRVDKNTGGGRGSKRGRMYIAGIPEEGTLSGVSQTWNADAIAVWQAGLNAFLSGINNAAPVSNIDGSMCVVHQVAGVGVSTTDVESLTVNPAVSTQVRRGLLR